MLQSLYIKNDKRRYVQGGKHMNTTKECSRNMAIAKFIIFSCLGIFLFFVSILFAAFGTESRKFQRMSRNPKSRFLLQGFL